MRRLEVLSEERNIFISIPFNHELIVRIRDRMDSEDYDHYELCINTHIICDFVEYDPKYQYDDEEIQKKVTDCREKVLGKINNIYKLIIDNWKRVIDGTSIRIVIDENLETSIVYI